MTKKGKVNRGAVNVDGYYNPEPPPPEEGSREPSDGLDQDGLESPRARLEVVFSPYSS
jgi:hypothetical protein